MQKKQQHDSVSDTYAAHTCFSGSQRLLLGLQRMCKCLNPHGLSVAQVHSEHDLAGPNSPYKTLTWDKYVQSLDEHQHIKAYGHAW